MEFPKILITASEKFSDETCSEHVDIFVPKQRGHFSRMPGQNGDKYLGDKFFGDKFFGDKFLGDKFLGDKFLGDKFLGDKFLGDTFSVRDKSLCDAFGTCWHFELAISECLFLRPCLNNLFGIRSLKF